MIKSRIKGVPALNEAKDLLKEAGESSPGPWVDHSLYAGKAAELIAKNCKGLDTETALVLGMLHDMGRRYDVTDMRYVIDGYNFCMDRGYNFLAKICI